MKVVFARRALSDLMEIFDYIAAQDVGTAVSVEADIRRACEDLAHFPYANPATDIANVYRMPIPTRGYTVFYRVRRRDAVVEIARIVRSARIRALGRIPR